MSVDVASENDSVRGPPASEYQDSSEDVRGIDSGDDGDEAAWAREQDEKKVGRALGNLSKVSARLGCGCVLSNHLIAQIDSLAAIVKTEAAGLVPVRRANAAPKLQKCKIRLRDLPEDVQRQFRKTFTPALLRYAGTLSPWQNIQSGAELAKIWDPLFPDHKLADDERLQTIVVKLVCPSLLILTAFT
jgi:hypothetical protein